MKNIFLLLLLTACSAATADQHDAISSIYWSDGDSGRIDDMKFRLADVDAPETGGVGAAVGPAQCEAERVLGYEAKAFMVELTRNAELEITEIQGTTTYDRKVITLSADGVDVGETGMESGHLRAWLHDGNRAIMPRPDWCLKYQ